MKRLLGSWIFIITMVLIDLYVFQSLKLVTASLSSKLRLGIHIAYWSFTAAAIILFLIIPYIQFEALPKFIRVYVIAILFGFFIAKFIAMIFFLVDDARRLLQWGGIKTYQLVKGETTSTDAISRSLFLSWLGIGVGGGLFGTLLYGFGNKYRYRIEKVKFQSNKIPAPFKGLKIVQISDIHSGSLDDLSAVQKGIQKINDLQPDVVFFTGDLVNNMAKEMEDKIELFSSIKAPLGVYSILGNHDYGDYVAWPSAEAKKGNLDRLKNIHAQMGWRLLLNEHVAIEKDGASIGLIGIENWGARANFAKYGDLKKAYEGADQYPFKILLSHDPSHWDAEVCKHYSDIDLMLSGHTHGMQFGVEIPGFRWSPVQYVYKQWGGFYKNGEQHLYVNRGFGFLGYPGRVGILPEITLIELV
jgi:predicted MPP superfamily phosphohydrolase